MVERMATDSERTFASEDDPFEYNLRNAVQSGIGTRFNNIVRTQPLKDELPFERKELYRQRLLDVFHHELFGCMLGYKDFRTLDLSVTDNKAETFVCYMSGRGYTIKLWLGGSDPRLAHIGR